MKITILANDNTACIPYYLYRELNMLDGVKCGFYQCRNNYLMYPHGEFIRDTKIKRLLREMRESDVVLLNEPVWNMIYPPYRTSFKNSTHKINLISKLSNGQKVIRYSHGTYTRNEYKRINSVCKEHNIRQICSTPDMLELLNNDAKWLPQIVPMRKDRTYRFNPPPIKDKKILISHSPTNRHIKGTDEFMRSINSLIRDGYNLSPVLIENRTHQKCMETKARCHIHYDQKSLGAYGVSAIEGLALGQVVVVGIQKVKDYIPDNPFIDANRYTMKESLRRAIEIVISNNKRRNAVLNGRRWAETIHGSSAIISRFFEIVDDTEGYAQ
jgi:hypothetical protein